MIVVDTSVWVAATRESTAYVAQTLRALIDADEAVLAQPVRLELLAGVARKDRMAFKRALSALPVVVPSEDTWRLIEGWIEPAADAGHRFAVTDLLIAALALDIDALVWSLDADFERLGALGLVRLYDEAPGATGDHRRRREVIDLPTPHRFALGGGRKFSITYTPSWDSLRALLLCQKATLFPPGWTRRSRISFTPKSIRRAWPPGAGMIQASAPCPNKIDRPSGVHEVHDPEADLRPSNARDSPPVSATTVSAIRFVAGLLQMAATWCPSGDRDTLIDWQTS